MRSGCTRSLLDPAVLALEAVIRKVIFPNIECQNANRAIKLTYPVLWVVTSVVAYRLEFPPAITCGTLSTSNKQAETNESEEEGCPARTAPGGKASARPVSSSRYESCGVAPVRRTRFKPRRQPGNRSECESH